MKLVYCSPIDGMINCLPLICLVKMQVKSFTYQQLADDDTYSYLWVGYEDASPRFVSLEAFLHL
jgi:hypothetical protein